MITTVQQVKDYLGIKDNASDALLGQLVAAADSFVLSYIETDSVLETDYVERYNGTGSERLVPDHNPIKSITSLKVNGREIPPQPEYGQRGYFFDKNIIVLSGEKFLVGFRNVEISYRAGLPTVPPDMAQAATYIASQMWKRRDRIGVSSKSIGQESISFSPNDLDASSRTILNQYKKRWLSR
jgi:hypothetical protein